MQTFSIHIPAGTIVLAQHNRRDRSGRVVGIESRTVTLQGGCYIDDATRNEDGAYSYCLRPDEKDATVYTCCTSSATVLAV